MTIYEARAMLKALERRGLAYEWLGHEGVDGDRDVARGRYVITPAGEKSVNYSYGAFGAPRDDRQQAS